MNTPTPLHTVSVTIEWRRPWDLFLKLQAWAIVLTVLSVAVLVSSVRAVLTPHAGKPGLGRVTITPSPQTQAVHSAGVPASGN